VKKTLVDKIVSRLDRKFHSEWSDLRIEYYTSQLGPSDRKAFEFYIVPYHDYYTLTQEEAQEYTESLSACFTSINTALKKLLRGEKFIDFEVEKIPEFENFIYKLRVIIFYKKERIKELLRGAPNET
jgi:hypothetical protein